MLLRYLLFLSLLDPITRCLNLKLNNVCTSFQDYYYPEGNENCYYDPDMTMTTPELIKKYAGQVEIHDVTTEDGYILTLYRIPRQNPKGVILIHHSIATYSHIYMWQGNNSLAITLWQDGFDVWLANQRGTTISNKHINMTSFDYSYWDFGFHEMGIHDVSSEVKFINRMTNGSKVIFFGHSLGSTIGLIYSSMKPVEADNYIKSMILLATPCYFEYGTSLIYLFKNFVPLLEYFVKILHLGSPLIILPLLIPISRIVLRLFPTILFIVNVMIWAFCGYTPNQTDPTFFNFEGAMYSNNFSWKTLIHYAQLSNSNHRFQMYDYGEKENLKKYDSKLPPLYPIENITVPILLVSSYSDSLISLKDSETLFNEFPERIKIYGHWKLSGLNHLDYHLGLHRKEIFADNLLMFLNGL